MNVKFSVVIFGRDFKMSRGFIFGVYFLGVHYLNRGIFFGLRAPHQGESSQPALFLSQQLSIWALEAQLDQPDTARLDQIFCRQAPELFFEKVLAFFEKVSLNEKKNEKNFSKNETFLKKFHFFKQFFGGFSE